MTIMWEKGIGTFKNPEAAFYHIKRAAKLGHT